MTTLSDLRHILDDESDSPTMTDADRAEALRQYRYAAWVAQDDE
jgi:hypothetical protein